MFPENRFMEVLIIGALALIVIGPKDLPLLMRRLGQFMGRMRAMAAEFRASFDELARQSELDELRREVDALRNSARPSETAPEAGVFDDIKSSLSTQPAPVMTPLPQPELVPVPSPAEPPTTIAEAPPKPARKSRAKPKAAPADTDGAHESSTSATGSPS
ncbi:MAG TPA: Sec-independent protein translocase protein TatB [Caulobacteraceae bacterium]|jgi:sec-independent protein translocase protein TatB|nr:Sec-independent protein translocase protein TatB [Caulobacteraceae bacterium]